jgi:hypothetical protein
MMGTEDIQFHNWSKSTSGANDTAQNHDLRRFESTSYEKVCPKSVFSFDFGGVYCREISELPLQAHYWAKNGNIFSRIFEVKLRQLKCPPLGFTPFLGRSSSSCLAICSPHENNYFSLNYQDCEICKAICRQIFLRSARNYRDLGRALAREPLIISEHSAACMRNSLRTLISHKCLLPWRLGDPKRPRYDRPTRAVLSGHFT